MKTVTNDFILSQNGQNLKYIKHCYISRRLLTGSGWAAPLDISHMIAQYGRVTWKLDTDALNQWKNSNITLIVKNASNQWKENNDAGILYGYMAYHSKIEITAGLVLPDGSEETLYIFRGVITNISTNSSDGRAQITIEGQEALLQQSDAENVSTLVTEENIGTGNGTAGPFGPTTFPGVGKIIGVYVDGVLKQAGLHYDITNFNIKTLGVSITFKATYYPTTGQAITISYRYWYQNQTIDYLVGKLLDEAGITNRTIQPVVFDNEVFNNWVQDSQADFEASGTVPVNIDTSSEPGKIKLARDIYIKTTDMLIGKPTTVSGIYLFYFGIFAVDNSDSTFFASQLIGSGGDGWVFVDLQATKTIGKVRLKGGNATASTPVYWQYSNDGTSWTTFHTTTPTTTTEDVTYTIPSPFACRYMRIFCNAGFRLLVYTLSAFEYVNDYFSTGSWISQKHDAGVTIIGFGKLTFNANLNGQTLTPYTQTSSDGTTWTEPWLALSADGFILSAVKRYFRIKFDIATTVGTITPELLDLTANWTTGSVLIDYADFSNMTVQAAIEELAKMPDYEIGFKAENGYYFFRSKDVSTTPVFTFKDSKNIIKIDNCSPGYEKIYNLIRCTYGIYTKEVTPITQADPGPNSFTLYGKRVLNITGGQLTLSDSVNIANGIAERYYNRYSQPKKLLRILAKFLPQLDLSDTVTVEMHTPGPVTANFFGDGARWGAITPSVWTEYLCDVLPPAATPPWTESGANKNTIHTIVSGKLNIFSTGSLIPLYNPGVYDLQMTDGLPATGPIRITFKVETDATPIIGNDTVVIVIAIYTRGQWRQIDFRTNRCIIYPGGTGNEIAIDLNVPHEYTIDIFTDGDTGQQVNLYIDGSLAWAGTQNMTGSYVPLAVSTLIGEPGKTVKFHYIKWGYIKTGGVSFWTGQEQFYLWKNTGKIIGLTLDLANFTTELDYREI